MNVSVYPFIFVTAGISHMGNVEQCVKMLHCSFEYMRD
uniref:Uncharacterized protein n=1 Tax=Arundo donax TaxID=35708 RepID=A0A0A9TRH4_ARUDO